MIFDPRPVSHPLGGLRGWGHKVKFTFVRTRMQQHGSKYSAHPIPLTLWLGSKDQNSFFQKMVMLHIKLKRNTNAAIMIANILPAYRPLTQGMGSIDQNSKFSEHGMLHVKLRGHTKCSSMVANILPADPPLPWGWGQ